MDKEATQTTGGADLLPGATHPAPRGAGTFSILAVTASAKGATAHLLDPVIFIHLRQTP